MLRTIHLYGYLAEKYGAKHKYEVKSVGEALRALEANFKGFIQSIVADKRYRIVRGDTLNDERIGEKQMLLQYGKGDFHILPVIEGAGGDADIWITVLGVVLMVASFWCGPLAPHVFMLGLSLTMTGVSMMMTNNASNDDYGGQEDPKERKSFHFNGPTNTIEQGGVLPLVYGRMIVGSVVVSAGIDIEEIGTGV